MNFSEWTRDKKRKNQQVDLQETTKETSAAPAAKASSFAEWTKNQTAGQPSQTGQSRNAGPQSFSEWIRQNRGDSAWREEDVAVRQRNDYISDYTQRANREFSAQRNRYVAPETAAQRQTEAASQARAAKNAGTEILKTMRQSGRYTDEETRRALERLTAGDDAMETVRKNAENDTAFRSQFQTEGQYNAWKKLQEYENLRNNPDFAEKSQYKSTANGNEPAIDNFAGKYLDTGYNDTVYDTINGDETARKRLLNSYDSRDYDFDNIPEDTKALFNYIYATQGQDAAYDYLDGAVGQRYNGVKALTFGALQGTGLASLSALAGEGVAAITGDQEIKDRNREWYGDFLRDSQGSREQNKAAYGVGNVAGNLGMMYALGGITGGLTGSAGQAVGSAAAKGLAAKGAGKAAQYIVGETVSKAVTSGLTYMAADAVRNSGTYATGNMSGADYWKSLGISGAQGMANGLTNGLVNSGIADILRRSGNMTLFAEFVRQTVAGTASAAAVMETGYALRGERPDDAQVATDLATAFAFSVLQSAVSSYQASQANKSAMEAAVREIQSRYSAMTEDWNDMTPEQRADTAARIGVATQQLRADLNSYYIAGQQNTVNDLNAALEIIERGMGNYVSGFTAANGAATASYGGNLLGGETYDFGGATSNIGADVSQEMQSAVEQGVALAQQGGGLADLPAKDAGVSGGMGAAAATVQTGSDILAQAAREVANGGTVSNTTAQEILADPEAVSTLEEAAGLVVSDEMTRAQQRRAVKSAVETLASAQGESTQPQSEIIPLGEAKPQETAQQPQTPETQRTEAIMARDTKAVAAFGTTLGKAGETALTKMYDPQTRADSYIRGMVDYYNAGAKGLDFDKVQTTGTLAGPQKEAAYLAGNADADSNIVNGGQNNGTAEEPAEVYLRNGGQRDYGTDSGGELRAVEGGAGQNSGWHVETQPADAGAAALSYGQEVSTASLGFSGGLEDDAIHLVTGGDTEATSASKSLAESRGLEVTFFGGGNLSIRREDGGIASARAAYVDGNRLYVRADHPEFTAEQLTRHEVGHDMLEKGEIDRDKTMARARELLGDQRFQESIDQYEAAYRESGLTPEDVRDEVICDSLGGMNIFHGISGMEETAQNILDASFVATEEQKQANGTRGPPEGNVKLSRDMNERNRALRKGEMVNEFRDKINWPRYYQEISKDEYNPDHYEDGEIATMDLDGSVLMLQMQRNGEWSVIKMEDSYGNSQGRNGAEAPAKDGQHGFSRERKNNSGVGASVRAGTHRTHGEPTGQGGNDQGNGQGSAADPSKASGKIKTKFSMETPVEETKDLVALHNVSEQGLLGAIDLGGLPSPSIAITKSEMGHTKYGPISLVFSKDTIDPQLFRSNKVYGSDAWTPTAPAVEYPVNSKKLTAVEQEFHKLAKNTDVAGGIFGNSSSIRGMGVDDVSGKSKAELAKALAQTDTIRAAYLADQGKTLEPVKQTKVWDRYGNNSLQSFVDQVGSQRLAEMMTALELGENSQTALGQDAETLDGILRDYYKQSGEAMLQRMAVRKKWTAQEIKEQRQSRIDRAMENVTTFAKEDFIRHAWEMYQDGGATKGEIDRLATSDALREAVNDSDVEAWVTQKLDGLLGGPGIYNGKDRYTASGNTRTFKQTHYDYTLENIVKAMKENQQAKGEGIWGASAGSLMAVATPEYASIDEIRADKGRIRSASEEEYNRIKDQLREQIDQVILGIRKTNRAMTDNQFEEIDHIGSALIDGAKGKQTPADIRKAFQEYGYTVGDNLIAPIQQLYKAAADTPTEYFEAKPQRAVGFDEVLAAVVPDNASEKLVEALGEKGVRVIPYEAGNDTDRIQKVNSVEGAKFSQDLPELENLRKENKRLQAQVESWKGQLKRTTPENRTVRQKDVDKLAKRLISAYDSTLDTAEVSADLKKLGEYIVRGGDGKNELTWDAVHDSALTIGRKLVENALAADDSAYKAYTELRKYLRDTKITIGPEYAGDIPDFKAFKDSYKGKLRLSLGDKTNVDQVYQELSENWPELFSEAGEAHPTDQILRISDVLDGLTPIYENPHSYDMDRAAEYAAGDILDSIMGEDVRQEPPTFADKQARKLEDAVARERVEKDAAVAAEREKRSDTILAERMAAGRAIAKERTIRDQKLQALKDHYAEIQDRRRERREDSNARTRLLKIAKRLQNKKLPAVNRALLDQYIGDLDTAAKSMTGKTLENLFELQSWYTGQKENNPDFIADPNVEKALSRLQKRQISSLTANEVRDLTDVLLNIENEIRTQRKLIDSQDRRDVYHMGQDVIRDVYNTKGSKGGVLDKYLVTETLSPVRQIRRMTGYVDTDPLYVLTQGLADGQRDMMAYQMRSSRPFEKFANDKKFNERFSGKKAEKIEIRGVTIQGQDVKVNITPAMRVSLYLHSLNDDNLRHIAGGGVTIPDEKLYRKGDMGEAYARGVTIRMTPSDIRAITSKMTDQERSFAKAVQKYFNEDSKTALNEVSEKLKGYPVAEVENYFPINTDSNFTRSEFESLKRDGTIEGMGFLKERVVAKNPILLRDASDVVDQAIRMHGKYVGLAIPVRNFNKIWNVTTTAYGEDGNSAYPTGSVQSAIESRWGKTGTKYVDKLMGDLQGSTQTKNVWAKALNKVRSNYAGAVLTLNLSVAMKQAASYPTAAAVLGWKPLAQAMKDFGKVDLGLIEKYTPLQWYRSKGFSTKELGDMKSSGRSLPEWLNWVQGVDLITTRKLWKASEYYVRDYQKNLAVGSDEYYKAVAQIYNRVIEETQPNYTIMQRPQLLRSDDTLMGNLAMFKTQPFQNTGIVYDAVGNYLAKAEQAKYGGEEAKAEAKAARRNMGWAITSQLGQLAVFAGMTLMWALARGKKDKYEDEDGNLTAGSVLAAVGKDMIGGALSGIPFGSDAWELVSSKLFGDKYYGLDAVTVTAIQDTLEAMNSLTDQLGRIGKAALNGGEINWNSERLKLDTDLDSFSKAVGVPYENVLNLGKVVVRQTVVRSLGQNVGEYAYLKLTTDPEKYPSDYYDVLYKAMGDNQEDYEKIYQDMLNFGFDEDKIRNAMEKRMKEDQGVKNVSDLDHRYLSPTQEVSWNGVYEGLSGSSLWGSATEAQRDAVEDKLYNVVTQNSAGEKLREKIDGGAAYGLDETEYMLYLLALSMADKPTESGKMGSYTNDEVAEAIRMVPGLTDEERSYLWTAQGKNEKSNPWG